MWRSNAPLSLEAFSGLRAEMGVPPASRTRFCPACGDIWARSVLMEGRVMSVDCTTLSANPGAHRSG